MASRARANLGSQELAGTQGVHQLIEEPWHAVADLRRGERNRRPESGLCRAPPDDVFPV